VMADWRLGGLLELLEDSLEELGHSSRLSSSKFARLPGYEFWQFERRFSASQTGNSAEGGGRGSLEMNLAPVDRVTC
jgi:hypothetical protein